MHSALQGDASINALNALLDAMPAVHTKKTEQQVEINSHKVRLDKKK